MDFCYFIFEEIKWVLIRSSKSQFKFSFNSSSEIKYITEFVFAGGFKNKEGAELIIECKNSLLCLPDFATLSKEQFIPIDTPNFSRNMTADLDLFFSRFKLPSEILEVFGKDFFEFRWGKDESFDQLANEAYNKSK
jgi:hypothetical protein